MFLPTGTGEPYAWNASHEFVYMLMSDRGDALRVEVRNVARVARERFLASSARDDELFDSRILAAVG